MTTRLKMHSASRTLRMTAILPMLAAGSLAAQERLPITTDLRASKRLVGPPPPAGVSVTGTPALARVAWQLVPGVGVAAYSVERWLQSNPDCCRASSPLLGAEATGWEDRLPWSGTYVYRVTAHYPDGSQGSVVVNFARPEPSNPAVLTATWPFLGMACKKVWMGPIRQWVPVCTIKVRLSWPKVPGAAFYMLWGPGLLNTGVQLNTSVLNGEEVHPSSYEVSNASNGTPNVVELTYGMNTWTIGAFFLPGPVSTPAANFTKGSLTIPAPK